MILLSLADHLLDLGDEVFGFSLLLGSNHRSVTPRHEAVQLVYGLRDAGHRDKLVARQAGVGPEFDARLIVTKNA